MTILVRLWQAACVAAIVLCYPMAIAGCILIPVLVFGGAADRGDHWLSGLVVGLIGAALWYRLFDSISAVLFACAGGELEGQLDTVSDALADYPGREQNRAKQDLSIELTNFINPAHPMYEDDEKH